MRDREVIRRFGAAAVLAVALASGAAAAPVQRAEFDRSHSVFHCKIAARGPGNWIGDDILIQLPGTSAQAIVIDAVIEFTVGGPIRVPIRKTASGGLRLTWTLSVPTDDNREVPVAYTVEFRRDQFKGSMRANLPGNTGGRNTGKLSCSEGRFRK